MGIRRANVAAQVMEHLCRCELHGYSQPGRYGTSGYCTVQTDAGPIKVKKGDRDCSSAVCEAWELALVGTGYEGRITRYNWTGGIDGEPGDQTGNESLVRGYYEWWDGILHYNCGADDGEASGGGSSGADATGDLPMPRYRVAVMHNGAKCWLPWMRGMVDEGGSADTYVGEAGVGIVDIEFEGGSLGPNGWFTKNMSGGKLIGLTVHYDTPHPGNTGYYEAYYRVHWLSDPPAWGKWEHDNDDGGAGNDIDQLDMIELTIVPC